MTERPDDWLRARGAANDLVTWAGAFEDLESLWRACPRGDWLLTVAVVRGLPASALERAMLLVAELALDHVDEDERPRLAASLRAPARERLRLAATLEARAAAATSPALSAALSALALALAARTEDAARVPSLVAHAAVSDAGECAMMPALSYAQKRSAELVREIIPSIA